MDDGDRLVGGKISSTRVFPFVVGWNQHGFPNQMSCSGSLITPTYFLSAAHCNNILFPSPKDKDKIDELRQKCVEATERNEDYKVLVAQSGETFEYHLKCRWLKKTEAFEIFSDPPGKAWLGVNNINQKRVNPIREEVAIKRHIRHLKTYRYGPEAPEHWSPWRRTGKENFYEKLQQPKMPEVCGKQLCGYS